MTDESKLRVDAARGMQAEGLANSDLLKEAFATLEDSYIKTWRATKIEDVSGREKLFLAINIVGKVRDHLTAVINDGKLAAAELTSLARIAERQKSWHEVQ